MSSWQIFLELTVKAAPITEHESTAVTQRAGVILM